MERTETYSPLHKTVHWLTAILVAVLLPIGFYMVWRYGATDNDAMTVRLFDLHKLLGLVVLCLLVVRVAVRLARGVPPPASFARWQRLAAETNHLVIYVLLLAVPLLGWLGASAYDLNSLPGGLRLPALLAKDTDLAGRILWWHGWVAIALGLACAGHIGAALVHRVVLRDGVFERMWPSRNKS